MPGLIKINEGYDNIFTRRKRGHKLVIGCIHLLPMPNTPYYKSGDLERSVEKAVRDARTLKENGADGCIIQNVDGIFVPTDDTDYVNVACMASVGTHVRTEVGKDFLVGVQIMWNSITPSLAAAKACGADFTRCAALTGVSRSPFGAIEGNPMKVMNYRRYIDAEHVAMIAEISGYHFLNEQEYNREIVVSHAKDALTAGGNAIELFAKDEEINEKMVRDVKEAFDVPVILGGGTNIENAARRLKYADGAIVGTCFEKGVWGGSVQADAVKAYVENVRKV